MYAIATFKVAEVTNLTFLRGGGELFTYIAMLAWAIVFMGMLHSLARSRFQSH